MMGVYVCCGHVLHVIRAGSWPVIVPPPFALVLMTGTMISLSASRRYRESPGTGLYRRLQSLSAKQLSTRSSLSYIVSTYPIYFTRILIYIPLLTRFSRDDNISLTSYSSSLLTRSRGGYKSSTIYNRNRSVIVGRTNSIQKTRYILDSILRYIICNIGISSIQYYI